MKRIEAIIRPQNIDDVREALIEAGIKEMKVYEIRDIGRQKGHTELYRTSEYNFDFVQKLKIEVIITDKDAEIAIKTILKVIKSSQIGDGEIFISKIDEAIQIRTEEIEESVV